MPRYFSGRMSPLHGEGRRFEPVTRYQRQRGIGVVVTQDLAKVRSRVRFSHPAPYILKGTQCLDIQVNLQQKK